MRNIILHHHFFKNAGSTLIAALTREFGNDFIEHHPSGESVGTFSPENLAVLLNENPNLKAVSSHHMTGIDYSRYPILMDDFKFFDFILVRHPLKRLMSAYSYYQTLDKNSHPLIDVAQSTSLVVFLNFLIREKPDHVTSPQVKFLSGAKAPLSRTHINPAIERLVGCAVCGTVDNYFDTMVIAEFRMVPFFPNLKLHYSIVNASPPASAYDGTLESIEYLIGRDLYNKLIDLNALDIELCEAADNEINRRMQSIPQYYRVAESFSKRCAELKNGRAHIAAN